MSLEYGSGILTESMQRDAARERFSEWLQNVFGQVPQVGLGTYTFRDLVLPSGQKVLPGRQRVTRAAERLVSLLMENGSTCFVCVEVGSDTRRLHLHSLESNEGRARAIVHSWWRRTHGHESSRVVESRAGASAYVTKYVTKSDLPFWAGGPLFRSSRSRVELGVDRRGSVVVGEESLLAIASG